MSVDSEEYNDNVDDMPNKGGRPSYGPNERDEGALTALLSIGFPHKQIALYMGKNIKTLKKHYPDLFETICPMDEKTANVENALYYLAVHKLNVVACLAWLKAHRKEVYSDKAQQANNSGEMDSNEFLAAISKNLPN